VGKTIPTLLILLFVVSNASAQTPQRTDSRWTRWVGCWQLVDESLRERGGGSVTPQTASGVSVCVLPADEPAAVRLKTTITSQPVLEQTIAADGADHPVTDAGCRGTQRAEWSNTGKRLFTSAQVVCDDERLRKISGLTMIDGTGTWVDVQAVDVGGQESIRVRRYRQAPEQRAAMNPALSPDGALTFDDVKEASGKVRKVSPAVIEAALMATRARIDLNSRRLLDLNRAGVPASVIDWMVALAYPDHFVVDRRYQGGATSSFALSSASSSYFQYLSGSLYPYDQYDIYPYNAYYYSPFAYPYIVPTFVSGDASGGSSPTVAAGEGRLINGVGYVRLRQREASGSEGSDGGQNGSGSISTRGSSSDSATSFGSSSSGSSGSSDSSGGATSGGYSSGSSSGDGGGRTAQPR